MQSIENNNNDLNVVTLNGHLCNYFRGPTLIAQKDIDVSELNVLCDLLEEEFSKLYSTKAPFYEENYEIFHPEGKSVRFMKKHKKGGQVRPIIKALNGVPLWNNVELELFFKVLEKSGFRIK